MFDNWRLRSLWLCWFVILVLLAQCYLMFRAVSRCQQYNQLPWSTSTKPIAELYIYIVFIVLSIMSIPFFVISSLIQLGNYANDAIRLGQNPSLALPSTILEMVWQNFGPVNSFCHIVAAYSLLLPAILTTARQIKHGFLSSDFAWQSVLDGLFLDESTSNHTKSGVQTSVTAMAGLTPELLNYAGALLVYNVRYASVFWRTKPEFSLVFSLHLVVSSCLFLFSFCAMSILYKVEMSNLALLILPGSMIIILNVVSCFFIFVSSISVFNYGLYHFNQTLSRDDKTCVSLLQGYAPHVSATSLLVIVVALRAPLVYDSVTLYRLSGKSVLLAAISCDVIYMLIWISIWFCFTLKQQWQFYIPPSELASNGTSHFKRLDQLVQQKSDSQFIVSDGMKHVEESLALPEMTSTSVMHCQSVQNHGGSASIEGDSPDNTLTRIYRRSLRNLSRRYFHKDFISSTAIGNKNVMSPRATNAQLFQKQQPVFPQANVRPFLPLSTERSSSAPPLFPRRICRRNHGYIPEMRSPLDSALPSSNEASSSGSADHMLCSQV